MISVMEQDLGTSAGVEPIKDRHTVGYIAGLRELYEWIPQGVIEDDSTSGTQSSD